MRAACLHLSGTLHGSPKSQLTDGAVVYAGEAGEASEICGTQPINERRQARLFIDACERIIANIKLTTPTGFYTIA